MHGKSAKKRMRLLNHGPNGSQDGNALVNGGISTQKIIITSVIHIPNKWPWHLFEHNRQWMVIMARQFVFEIW